MPTVTARQTRVARTAQPPVLKTILPLAAADAVYRWDWPDTLAERARFLAEHLDQSGPTAQNLTLIHVPGGAAFGAFSVRKNVWLAFTIPASRNDEPSPHDFYRLANDIADLARQSPEPEPVLELLWRFWSHDPQGSVTDTEAKAIDLSVFLVRPRGPGVRSPAEAAPSRTPIKELLATYEDGSCEFAQPNHRIRPPQPREVQRVVLGFLPILFPGYYGLAPHDKGFKSFVLRRASALQHKLNRLAVRAVAYAEAAGLVQDVEPSPPTPEERVLSFFERLPQLRRLLSKDAQAAFERDPALEEWETDQVCLAYPGLFAVAVYRIAHALYEAGIPYIPRMATEFAHGKTGIDIHPAAVIGEGLFIDHGTGVTIGQTCVIGNNVTLYQGVTLGAWIFPLDDDGNLARGAKRHPTLGDDIVVYANAAALGDIQVRDRTRIGANVSLRQSTDPESVVRLPLSLRELSISSPRLALEDQVLNRPGGSAVTEEAGPPDPEASLATDFQRGTAERDAIEANYRDPETGLTGTMLELKRDEREYRTVPRDLRRPMD